MLCRRCNAYRTARRRFPLERRAIRICKDCGCAVSHQSVRGKYRCRACYNQYRKGTSNSSRSANSTKRRRLVDRLNCGSFYCDDKDGNGHWAYEEIGHGLTVAAAWASLRKCWRGYRIASGNFDEDGKKMYAERIVFLCRMLKIKSPRFQELEMSETVRNDDYDDDYDGNHDSSAEDYSEESDGSSPYYYSGGSVDSNCCD